MKLNLSADTKFTRTLYTALLSLAGALIMLLVIGTIFGVARSSNAKPILRLGKSNKTELAARAEDIRVFAGLQRLRIPLSNSSTLVLSIAFPYYHNDIAFTEELAAKINDFKEIARSYFASLPPEKAARIDEEAAKTEVLKRFNDVLRLGRVETLYFTEMMILSPGS